MYYNPIYFINDKIMWVTLIIIDIVYMIKLIKKSLPIIDSAKEIAWNDIFEMLSKDVGIFNIMKLSKKNIYKIVKRYIKKKRKPLLWLKLRLIIRTVICGVVILYPKNSVLVNIMSHYWIIGGVFVGIKWSSVLVMFSNLFILFLSVMSEFGQKEGNPFFVKRNVKQNVFESYLKEDYIDLDE